MAFTLVGSTTYPSAADTLFNNADPERMANFFDSVTAMGVDAERSLLFYGEYSEARTQIPIACWLTAKPIT